MRKTSTCSFRTLRIVIVPPSITVSFVVIVRMACAVELGVKIAPTVRGPWSAWIMLMAPSAVHYVMVCGTLATIVVSIT